MLKIAVNIKDGAILLLIVTIFFQKYIYSEDGLKEMDLETNDKYCGIFNRLVRLFPLFKSAFDDGGNPKNLKVLFVKTLIMLIRLFLN